MRSPTDYKDVPPAFMAAATEVMAEVVCARMGLPRERLKSIETFDPSISGRTGVEFNFEPELNEEEEKRLRAVAVAISREANARAPVFPGKA